VLPPHRTMVEGIIESAVVGSSKEHSVVTAEQCIDRRAGTAAAPCLTERIVCVDGWCGRCLAAVSAGDECSVPFRQQ
jgi:hypothetical protein